MKTLVIVESPKKAKEIQKYLGKGYIVRATAGHIADLVKGGDKKLGIKIDDGFKPVYAFDPEKKDKIEAIVDAAKQADMIFCAGDPDREGTAISFHVADALRAKKILAPIKRVLFHEITKNGIKKGVDNPIELDENQYAAQQARRVLDRIVGFMVSPFLIECVGPNLSAGRVQSVALRMIVDRDREIEQFIPEEYWNITANLAKSDTFSEVFLAKLQGEKIRTSAEAEKIHNQLRTDTFTVTEIVTEEKPKKPLPPFETATLQQAASKKYKFSSEKTMKLAQSLYESGLVTYIRTDSLRSSPEAITSLRDWLAAHGYDVPKAATAFSAKGNAQDAHEAIRPTDLENTKENINVSEDERKLYSLIWERFVASQMNPAVYDYVTVTISSSTGYIFRATGKALKYKGWLEIINAKSEDDILPILKKGEKVILTDPFIKIEQKFTQPPSRYKDYHLVEALKSKGIGRPSTYAAILKKVADRSYVEVENDTYISTELGKKVVDVLTPFFNFMQYAYTAEMEEKLDKIEEGGLTYVDMMTDFYSQFIKELHKASSSNEKDYGINCWGCSSPMRLRHGRFGYYMRCINLDCNATRSCDLVDEKPVFRETHKEPLVEGIHCPKCSSGMVKRDGKFGPFYACEKHPKCTGSRKIPSGDKCSKCGTDMFMTIFNGVNKLACMGYPNCKNIEEIPEGRAANWINPKDVNPIIKNKVVQKMLKSSKKS